MNATILQEHAYTVARGVRALALAGECGTQDATTTEVRQQIEECACPGAIPFVLDRGDGVTEYGYAAEPWVVELWSWVNKAQAVPAIHRHRLRGLLLGYSIGAIRMFEEQNSGVLFEQLVLRRPH